MPRKITEEQRNIIRSEYGVRPVSEVVEMTGLSYSSVTTHACRMGIRSCDDVGIFKTAFAKAMGLSYKAMKGKLGSKVGRYRLVIPSRSTKRIEDKHFQDIDAKNAGFKNLKSILIDHNIGSTSFFRWMSGRVKHNKVLEAYHWRKDLHGKWWGIEKSKLPNPERYGIHERGSTQDKAGDH